MARRRYRRRPRVYARAGCLGCSVPLLAGLATAIILAVIVM